MNVKTKQAEAKQVLKAINDFYYGEVPPPIHVTVANNSVYPGEKPGYYKASIKHEVIWVNKTVKTALWVIQFKLDKNNKLDAASLTYL